MVRYKRFRRRYKNTTNLIKMKFQSYMDIQTKAGEMQIISVSAGGKNILDRLPAQFSAYKYYKIGNISVKLVPASTLPVDPTGLSYEAGENTVDPRDQLTPGMMRITNGEDVFEDLTGLSEDFQHRLYNGMMLDPRWFKWMLQRGVKRHATPRYWQIGQLHQDKWPGSTLNVPEYETSEHGDIVGTKQYNFHADDTASTHASPGISSFRNGDSSSSMGLFQTGHKGVLGWLPTDGMQYGQPFVASPPEIEVMKIVLPPAYKTEYYYRMYISETVYFREPIVAFGQFAATDFGGFAPIDIFHTIPPGVPKKPTQVRADFLEDPQTGGNYGDD